MTWDKRLLQQMAGNRATPGDRALRRQQRRNAKLARSAEQRIKLVEQIMAREQGQPGFRMMPFANIGKKPGA
jgi:hypothetical protein